MIVAAVLICDRKRSSQLVALPAVVGIDYPDLSIYVNVESAMSESEIETQYQPMVQFLETQPRLFEAQPRPWDLDVWSITSTWRQKPAYDQDQRRLAPIVTARNMALDYMLAKGASHILFIDADVIPAPDGLRKLLALDVPLCGGYVPGRGAHSHVHYVFGHIRARGEIIECDHGTAGYMLIRRELASTLRFRWGGSRSDPARMLSEDPAYCEDAKLNGFGRFLIHTGARALHWDDPAQPFTGAGAARDNWEAVQQ